MNSHTLRLHAEPFQAIIDRRKTVEARLYDQKRQNIKCGDIIIFVSRQDPERSIRAKVTDLIHYSTFKALFATGPTQFGGETIEGLMQQVEQFYGAPDIERYGVVGIKFTVV